MDMGAFVIVINAEKVQVSGNKFNDKASAGRREGSDFLFGCTQPFGCIPAVL
jgi:ribosomal protein L13